MTHESKLMQRYIQVTSDRLIGLLPQLKYCELWLGTPPAPAPALSL